MKRFGFTIGVLLLLTLSGTAGWYLGSPLFLNQTVDEALPFVLPGPTTVAETSVEVVAQEQTENESGANEEETPMQLPIAGEVGMIMPPTGEPSADVVAEAVPTAAPTESPTAAVDEIITEPTAANVPAVLAHGHFQDGDSFHKGSGSATLYEGPDGDYLLRFDDFTVTNGPDLHVLLSTNPLPTSHDSLETYLDLGQLKGNIGNQNYTLSAGSDLSQFKSVVIYCLPFQVIFATATLEQEALS